MSAPIETLALSKRYGRQWALRECSLRVEPGHITGLVGPNGAGKTTLLQLAVGLLRPTSGEIRVFGRSPQKDLIFLLDRIGFVAQDTPLYRSFSVAEMLCFARRTNRRWDQALAEERLRRLEIPRDRPTGRLSGGQRAQVALALALGKRPELLLLDEPVASLDPLARREFMQALTEAVAEEETTVLLSSHLVSDLERICDRLVIINQGMLQVSGDLEELLGSHHLLTGPRLGEGVRPPGVEVVKEQHSERQSSFWVRGEPPALPAGWRAERLALEELVIAYLGSPSAAALPEPRLVEAVS